MPPETRFPVEDIFPALRSRAGGLEPHAIGCIRYTRQVAAGEGCRDGRWAGSGKVECGIHSGVDGEGI